MAFAICLPKTGNLVYGQGLQAAFPDRIGPGKGTLRFIFQVPADLVGTL
jgi:hypothetical protein